MEGEWRESGWREWGECGESVGRVGVKCRECWESVGEIVGRV